MKAPLQQVRHAHLLGARHDGGLCPAPAGTNVVRADPVEADAVVFAVGNK